MGKSWRAVLVLPHAMLLSLVRTSSSENEILVGCWISRDYEEDVVPRDRIELSTPAISGQTKNEQYQLITIKTKCKK
jgi:hypothetical protein